jgi:hypothetical protein
VSDTLKGHWTVTDEKHPDLVYEEKDGPVLILQLKTDTPHGMAKLIALHLNAWHAKPRREQAD